MFWPFWVTGSIIAKPECFGHFGDEIPLLNYHLGDQPAGKVAI